MRALLWSVKMSELRHREFKSLVPVSVEELGFKSKQSGSL